MSMYGFTEQKEAENLNGNGPKFGLNRGVFLSKFAFIENGGKGGSQGEALDIEFLIGERKVSYRKFPIQKFQDEKEEDFKLRVENYNACILDIVRCFAPDEQIKIALATVKDFKSFAQTLEKLIALNPQFSEKPLDLFFQYQYSIGKSNDRTYLEIPSYGKIYQGKFICPQVEGEFKENTEDGSLKYVGENETLHPFVRSKWFMESNYAKKQTLNKPAATEESNVFGNSENSEDTPDW